MNEREWDPRALRVIKIVGIAVAVLIFVLLTREPEPQPATPTVTPSASASPSVTDSPTEGARPPVPIPAPGSPIDEKDADAFAVGYLERVNSWRYDTDLLKWEKDIHYFIRPSVKDKYALTNNLTIDRLIECAEAKCERTATAKLLSTGAGATTDDYSATYEVISVITENGKKRTQRSVWSVYSKSGDPRIESSEDFGDIVYRED